MTNRDRLGVPGPLPLDAVSPTASFSELLVAQGLAPRWDADRIAGTLETAEATTVLALRWADGVVMAGDRRATAGNVIAHKRIKKVHPADEYSAVAISGTAGMAEELIKLFQTELEHYEKIEGSRLSLDGKANYLARMVRGNLALAFQGLVVVPLFCGYDEREGVGRLYSFDVVGGRYLVLVRPSVRQPLLQAVLISRLIERLGDRQAVVPEHDGYLHSLTAVYRVDVVGGRAEEQDYATTGSGGAEARSFLKGSWEASLDRDGGVRLAVEALVAAAEEDSATGGPDLRLGIYPNVVTVTADGFREVPEEQIAQVAAEVMESRP